MSNIGKTITVGVKVDKDNTAKAVNSGDLDVFATPTMIALMEYAAYTVLADTLEENESSVGIAVSVNHIAASPLGEQITATATITAIHGRKVEFALKAHDSKNEIGNGTHTRMIIDKDKFLSKLSDR